MLLGEALTEAAVITEEQLQKAITAKQRFSNLSLGKIVAKLFDVPIEIIETVFINKVVLPIIDQWFCQEVAKKSGPGGLNLGDMISQITIDLIAYHRYEGEMVYFRKNDQGYYLEQQRDVKLKSITVEIASIIVRTIRKQEVVFTNVSLEVSLDTKKVRAMNPGFVAEAKVKLLQAMKQQGRK